MSVSKPAGSPTKVDGTFSTILNKYVTHSTSLNNALHNTDRRRWAMFNLSSTSTYDQHFSITDSESIHNLFSREKLAETYSKAHTNIELGTWPWSAGDVMQAKIQVDFLAGTERDFRARHMSRIRNLSHEAVRQRLHSHDNGPLKGDVLSWASNISNPKSNLDQK